MGPEVNIPPRTPVKRQAQHVEPADQQYVFLGLLAAVYHLAALAGLVVWRQMCAGWRSGSEPPGRRLRYPDLTPVHRDG